MKVNNFAVLHEMCERNKDIKSFPTDNITNIRTGKDGWGRVEIAVDNATASGLMVGRHIVVMMLVYDIDQFNELKAEMERGEK